MALALALGTVPLGVTAHAESASSFDPGECGASNPATPQQGSDWHVKRLQLDKVHQLATGAGVTVAVIDTGVDPLHTEYFRPGQVTTVNFAANKISTQSKQVDCDHGTGVASLIAAQPGADDQTSFQGVAPGVHILALRALEKSPAKAGSNEEPQLESVDPTVAAINYAIDHHVDIISISQQGTADASYQAAIERAIRAGIVVVAAAGNHGAATNDIYPAAYPGVIAVGMTNKADLAPVESQHAPQLHVTVAAPGDPVLMLAPSADQGQSYASERGTSFAAPLVAGTVALMLEQNPDLTPAQVQERLEATADLPASAVPDPQIGWGIVDPYRALTDPAMAKRSVAPIPNKQTPTAPPRSPFDREQPDHTKRNVALAMAGGSLVAVCMAAVVAGSLPEGRRRGWRPGARRDRHG